MGEAWGRGGGGSMRVERALWRVDIFTDRSAGDWKRRRRNKKRVREGDLKVLV